MTKTLYCIEHEEMVGLEETNLGEGHTFSVEVATDTPYTFWDYEFCKFPLGFAFCPPPEFDMDTFMLTAQEPIEDDLSRVFEFLP